MRQWLIDAFTDRPFGGNPAWVCEPFAAWPDAPLLYTVGASPDRETLVGVATDGRVWLLTAGEGQWREAGMVEGQVQAAGITADGTIVIVDEDSIIMLPPGAAGAP